MSIHVQNRFEGGISETKRNNQLDGVIRRSFRIAKHFDIHHELGQLLPLKGFEDDSDATISNHEISRYEIVDNVLWGYGIVGGGSSAVEVFKKADPTGNWTEPADNNLSAGSRAEGCFVGYNKVLFGGTAFNSASARIWAYDTVGASITNSALALANATTIRQGIVHPADDILYIPYDNKIAAKNDPTTSEAVGDNWTAEALVLPGDMEITSISSYGAYIAIAAKSTKEGTSTVFLWRGLGFSDVTENIGWGTGQLELIGVIEGTLIGISKGVDDTVSATSNGSNAIIIKQLSGTIPQIIRVIPAAIDENSTTSISLTDHTDKRGERLYFGAKIKTEPGSTSDSYWQGLFSLGRRTINEPIAVNLEVVNENIDATNANASINGFKWWGNLVWISYTDANGDKKIERTLDGTSDTEYSQTSILESDVFTIGDPAQKKDLKGTSLSYVPLASGEQIVLKYRKDADIQGGSWTTIFTRTTANEIGHEDVQTVFEFHEVQFRIESTGGAIPTQFKFETDDRNNLLS